MNRDLNVHTKYQRGGPDTRRRVVIEPLTQPNTQVSVAGQVLVVLMVLVPVVIFLSGLYIYLTNR